eukprot:6888535-Prymnesium_polylepis.1
MARQAGLHGLGGALHRAPLHIGLALPELQGRGQRRREQQLLEWPRVRSVRRAHRQQQQQGLGPPDARGWRAG